MAGQDSEQFGASKTVVLLLPVSASFHSGTISRKTVCAKCKMKSTPPESAVK